MGADEIELLFDVIRSCQRCAEQLRNRSLERALVPLDDATLVGLQYQASLFYQLGVIRERINIRDSAYTLCARQNWSY